jgi:hypothetical protein
MTDIEEAKSLSEHLYEQLPRNDAEAALEAFYDAMRDSGSGTDWDNIESKPLKFNEENGQLEIGGKTIDAKRYKVESIEEGEAKINNHSDSMVDTLTINMTEGKAMEEAKKLFGMRGEAVVPITEEMIIAHMGEENGRMIWNKLVATTILDRILITQDAKGPEKKMEVRERNVGGKGIKHHQRKHQIRKSIQTAGRYLPGTQFGASRSKKERYRRKKKDKGAENFLIAIDVSTSNGSRSDPNSNLNAVTCAAAAIVQEAQAKNIAVSLYIFPNGSGGLGRVAGKGDLGDPNSDFRYPCMAPDAEGKMVDQARNMQCDIDPRYYYYNSKDYDSILKDLTENIHCYGGESPIQVMGKIASDLNKLPKKDKATTIWIADCTRPDEYTSTPAFVGAIEPRGDLYIFNVTDTRPNNNWSRQIADEFGIWPEQPNPRWPWVKYVPIPNFKVPGVNPDTIPGVIAEAMGLSRVKVKGDNVLRGFLKGDN